MEKDKKPALRFQGFTEAWEQRKVGELASDTYGGGTPTTSNDEFWNGTIPWIQSSDLSEHQMFGVTPRKYISKEAVMSSATKIVPENSLAIITRVGVGKLAIMPFPYTTSQDFLSLSKLKIDVVFSAYLLYKKLQSELNFVQGTSIKGITKDELLAKVLAVPERKEQEAIGLFFRSLDNLITLHQRKCDKLQNVKKSMLEKMFPKNGNTTPEIRFKGFTEAWEQRKVGELASDTYGGGTPTTSNDEFWNGTIPWIQSSDLSEHQMFGVTPRKYISKEAVMSSATKIVPENSLAIITRVGVGKLAIMPFPYTTSQDFLSLSKLKIDVVFSAYLLYKKLQSELNFVQGTSIKGITKDELLAKVLAVPERKEQEAIGLFFRSLDNLITLHQRELEKLKNIKKSCLEKMFI